MRNTPFSSSERDAAFWRKVDKTGGPDACWPWQGAVTTHGYGCFKFTPGRGGRVLGAHKIAYMLTKGEVPAGLQIRHACDNPVCCNPAHLSIGTRKDNAQDCVKRGRRSFAPKKLTLDIAREIRALHGKASSGQIAKRYNIDQSYVFQIWSQQAWKEPR